MQGDGGPDGDGGHVDNITSCNVVDNYLWLDEYKQNNNNITFVPSNTSNKRIMNTIQEDNNVESS